MACTQPHTLFLSFHPLYQPTYIIHTRTTNIYVYELMHFRWARARARVRSLVRSCCAVQTHLMVWALMLLVGPARRSASFLHIHFLCYNNNTLTRWSSVTGLLNSRLLQLQYLVVLHLQVNLIRLLLQQKTNVPRLFGLSCREKTRKMCERRINASLGPRSVSYNIIYNIYR